MSARKPSQPPGGSLAVFVLDIDGRPTLAFEVHGPAEADADLWTDLAALTSDGAPLCTPQSTLSLRLAAREEIAVFRHAIGRAPASDQPTMTFLVKIDGVVVVTVGPEQA
jgi:hypothetical protein